MSSIYLLGSERSGSNLLRTLLGNHSQISAPIAPHFCDVFYNQFYNYLPFTPSSKEELIQDIEKYINHNFNDWKLKLQAEKYKDCKSFIDFMHMVYTEKAESENKSHYFSKDNHNHRYALGILKDIPNAKFVYLYRDPRDQVASWLRTPLHLHTPFAAVNKWNVEQNEIFKLGTFYKVHFYSLKYEDLVDDPQGSISAVLEFLDLPIESACFETKPENKEAEKHPLWKNINKPVKKNNYGKFKDVLCQADLELIETVAKGNMQRLGYSLETEANWNKGNPYMFSLKQKLLSRRSRKKHKNFREKEMAVLKDKANLVNSIFKKFNR